METSIGIGSALGGVCVSALYAAESLASCAARRCAGAKPSAMVMDAMRQRRSMEGGGRKQETGNGKQGTGKANGVLGEQKAESRKQCTVSKAVIPAEAGSMFLRHTRIPASAGMTMSVCRSCFLLSAV